jgi:pyridoxine/pyridoxamine 5'-phosphate oxidase
MDWSAISLAARPAAIFQRLADAAREVADPLRTPALATGSGADAGVRTVVLREVNAEARQLIAFSDARAGKIRQLAADAATAWLFYEPVEKFQLRARGTTRVHHRDAETKRRWETVPPANRLNYCAAVAPGSELPDADAAFPSELRGQPPILASTARGGEHFAVLITIVSELDWLWLRPGGHWRARFAWTDGAWKGTWVAP